MSKNKLIVGNWKMNPVYPKEANNLFEKIKRASKKFKNIDVVVCPPSIYLENFSKKLKTKKINLGAQDLFWEQSGSHTGYLSGSQLKNVGAKYVIIGHSERRENGETDLEINKKVKASLQNIMKPIICIGEGKRDKDGEYLNFLQDQIRKALYQVNKKDLKDITIAYEPIWAIGKNAKREPKPNEIEEVRIHILKVVGDLYKTGGLPPVKIIYGGSVNKDNAEELLKSGVDGFLIGRASLDAGHFSKIIEISG